MKIVISGGTGFLGSRLLEGLRGLRHTLLVLTRRPFPPQAMRRGVIYLRWEGKRTPVRSITSRVVAWIRWISSELRIFRLKRGLEIELILPVILFSF